jgi:asparagine synthase (glutamine-hydrolysing)
MCGIAAIIGKLSTLKELDTMGAAIKRRGVKESYHRVKDLQVWFTHLPITNDTYSQPCTYSNITLWLNGYISNWKELAKEENLIAESDTELLTWWIAHKRPLERLNGFFAVLYHDGEQVHYFTDRYGIKQLYIYEHKGRTYICSELKGIKSVCPLEIDRDAIADWEYSLGVMTDTIYKGVRLAPRLDFKVPEKIEVDYQTAKDTLTMLWMRSVRRNKYEGAGCYLSGGVDSGIIAKWLKPTYSFSVDYLNDLSETDNIKKNSTGHHLTLICNNDLRDRYVQKTFDALDDLKVGSCYTNYAIAELASKYCKVVYSGAGGDEVFNGYSHRYAKPINEVIKRTSARGKQYDITHKEYDWLYLRGILIVEDRMGGWHTMETRYPLLDNDFVDYAISLPDEYLKDKRILKDISGLPDEVINGKKKGFSNPHYTNDQWTEIALWMI